jgi:uncharacterized protein YhjY with autotransporter beta-barrel domain
MRRPVFRLLALILLGLTALPASAQSPSVALAAQWDTICATASAGTLLLVRCDETANSSDPNANLTAAMGQHLEQIPGQARVATRDTANQAGGFHVESHENLSLFDRGNAASTLSLNVSDSIAPKWSLFVSLDGGRIKRDAGTNEAAFKAGTQHFTLGADWQAGQKLQLGAAINVDREGLDFTGTTSTADARYTSVIGYGSYSASPAWVIDGYAGSGWGSYSLTRSVNYSLPIIDEGAESIIVDGRFIVDELAFAHPDSDRRISGLGATWNWSHGATQGDLGFGYDLSRTHIDGYTETGGGGLALVVPGRTVETERLRIDGRFGRTISQNWGVWQPSLRIGWREELGNPRRRVTVRLAEDSLGNRITFDTEDPDKGWGEFALGSVFTFVHGQSAFIEYRQNFAHTFLHERTLSLGWRKEL